MSATIQETPGRQDTVEPRDGSSGDSPRGRRSFRQDALITTGLTFGTLTVYVYLVHWLKNTNLVTTNGLWKLPAVEQWSHFHVGTIDPSNFLYFPITGLGITLLPEGLIGGGWVRESVLNACWASVAVGAIFVTCRMMKMSRVSSAAAALAQAGFAFFIALGVTSEDIMGGYALLCLALCAGVWSSQHAGRRASIGWALTGVLFACTFLWEWRLLFPSLPGFGLAIVLLVGPIRERALRLAAFGGGILLTLVVAAIYWGTVDDKAGGFFHRITTLLWTGKATESGWAGWSSAKFRFLLIGTTQYVTGGQNTTEDHILSEPKTYVVALAIVGLFALLLLWGWRGRNSSAVRVGVIVTAATFVAACTMNLWSQPQDPQMQINAMLFLPFAVGATTEMLRHASPFRLDGRGAERRARTWRTAVGIVACLVGPALLVVNVWGPSGYADRQGWDADSLTRVRALASKVDLDRTVLVLQGFEGESTWLFELYGSDWDLPGGLPWGPAPSSRVKMIGMTSVPVYFPSLSPNATAQGMLTRIAASRDLGYDIVAGPMWKYSRALFANSISTVASPQKADALYHALHAAYCPHKIRVRGWAGDFYRLTPTPPSGSCAT